MMMVVGRSLIYIPMPSHAVPASSSASAPVSGPVQSGESFLPVDIVMACVASCVAGAFVMVYKVMAFK